VADPGGEQVAVRIDFGDGTPPEDAALTSDRSFDAIHYYAAHGTYTVRATAIDDDGATSAPRELTIVAADLAGVVYRDFNDNGRFDTGADEPFGGVPVYLDLDNDGTPDAGEPQAVTDATGNYAFPLLDPGTYVLRTVIIHVKRPRSVR